MLFEGFLPCVKQRFTFAPLLIILVFFSMILVVFSIILVFFSIITTWMHFKWLMPLSSVGRPLIRRLVKGRQSKTLTLSGCLEGLLQSLRSSASWSLRSNYLLLSRRGLLSRRRLEWCLLLHSRLRSLYIHRVYNRSSCLASTALGTSTALWST